MSPLVALLTTNLARGGAETQVALLARGLRRNGWEVSVISLVSPTAFTSELEASGISVFSLDMLPGDWNFLGPLRFLGLLRRLRPHILHAHMFHANLLARLARLICPVPVVLSTLHSAAESARDSDNVKWRDRVYRLTDPLAAATVAVAKAVAERHALAGAVPRRKLRIIPNGVDTDLFRPGDDRRDELRRSLGLGPEFAWLAVGRLMWKKGYETLLRAFGACSRGVLLIAGSGPQEDRLRRLASQSGARVRFLGQREDVPALMQACDAFVQSSVVEGMPVSLLEAAASGLVSVAADTGGVAETGVARLVPPADFAALSAEMSRVMDLPVEDRKRQGLAARRHIEAHFAAGAVVAHWEELYRELLAPWM